MDAKYTLVHKWMIKARSDLLSAKRLAQGKDPYLDTAIYHCQQTVEKAVKAWLVFHDQPFEKTHDLRLLMAQAAKTEPKFKQWFNIAEQVSPYATAYRYPGETLEPDADEFNKTFQSALKFYDFVCTLLPPEISKSKK